MVAYEDGKGAKRRWAQVPYLACQTVQDPREVSTDHLRPRGTEYPKPHSVRKHEEIRSFIFLAPERIGWKWATFVNCKEAHKNAKIINILWSADPVRIEKEKKPPFRAHQTKLGTSLMGMLQLKQIDVQC